MIQNFKCLFKRDIIKSFRNRFGSFDGLYALVLQTYYLQMDNKYNNIMSHRPSIIQMRLRQNRIKILAVKMKIMLTRTPTRTPITTMIVFIHILGHSSQTGHKVISSQWNKLTNNKWMVVIISSKLHFVYIYINTLRLYWK